MTLGGLLYNSIRGGTFLVSAGQESLYTIIWLVVINNVTTLNPETCKEIVVGIFN